MWWHSNQRWLSSDITDVSLSRCSAQAGAGAAQSRQRSELFRDTRSLGASAAGCRQLVTLPAERKEAGLGKGGILPVGCSRRQWCNQFEKRGFRTKTCNWSYSGLFQATWDSWRWQMLILSIHYIFLNWVSERAEGTGLTIYKPQSRMW